MLLLIPPHPLPQSSNSKVVRYACKNRGTIYNKIKSGNYCKLQGIPESAEYLNGPVTPPPARKKRFQTLKNNKYGYFEM